jgi:hypothetical protein
VDRGVCDPCERTFKKERDEWMFDEVGERERERWDYGNVLASEIGLLQLDELRTHVLPSKLASRKVERSADETMSRRVRWIAVSGWVRVGRGRLLRRGLWWLLIAIFRVVRLGVIVRGIHG